MYWKQKQSDYGIPSTLEQETKAFPTNSGKHEQIGMWFVTIHCAFNPQVPTQGSKHLLRMQALSRGQSLFSTHSGLQPRYGSPWYSGKQEHTPLSHIVFGPQGEGLQGSTVSTGAVKESICAADIVISWYAYMLLVWGYS